MERRRPAAIRVEIRPRGRPSAASVEEADAHPELARAEPMNRRMDPHRPCYFISIAAELASVHPRTLRIYEEEGLLAPQRRNNLRLYSEADIQRVRLIRFLTRRQGVNLAGVKVILQLEAAGKIRVYDLFKTDGVEPIGDDESSEGNLED